MQFNSYTFRSNARMKTLENYANFNQNFDTRPSLVTVYANHSHKFNKF